MPKPAIQPASAPHPALTTAEIDELIQLKQTLAPELARLKPSVDRAEALTKKIREAHKEDPGDKVSTELGTAFDLLVGQCRLEGVPNRQKIKKVFGIRECWDLIAGISQAAVKEALKRRNEPEAGAEAFFTFGKTGWREVTVVAKTLQPAAQQKTAA